MALYNTKSVKDLPQIEEIIEGNYLLVENDLGTNIIDFKDFVIGPNNASFYNTIVSLCSRSISMSATVDTKLQSTSARIVEENNTKIDSLTANYPRYFVVYPNQLTVIQGLRYGQTQFNSELASIVPADVNVIPTNTYAANMNWVLLLSSIQNPGNPPTPTPYTYTITISANTTVSRNAEFDLRVLTFY
jgi:hypothetical protein